GVRPLDSYRVIVIGYGLLGTLLGFLYIRLSPAAETGAALEQRLGASARGFFGLHRSRTMVLKLSSLFMIDAFAGGLVVQSLIAYWFYVRYGVEPALLGAIFFGSNFFAGLSALVAARVAARF